MSEALLLDKDGFLADLSLWNAGVAEALAASDNASLSEAHWEVLHALRAFYARTDTAPAMRPFVRLVKETLGPDKGNSIYLMELFGESPAKTAAKWAGLPRPTNCL